MEDTIQTNDTPELKKHKQWVAAVLGVLHAIARVTNSPMDYWSEGELPCDDHRPLFYFGHRTVQIELECEEHGGFCLSDLNEFRSDAAIVVSVDLDAGSYEIKGCVARERFAQEATIVNGHYFVPNEKLDDLTTLTTQAGIMSGSTANIFRIRYEDQCQYPFKAHGIYVLDGGYRFTAQPGHVDRDGVPKPFTPWFLNGVEDGIIHMVRQDGHIYSVPIDVGTAPELSQLRLTPFRVSDILPLEEAKTEMCPARTRSWSERLLYLW
jgi:hypothetical protein